MSIGARRGWPSRPPAISIHHNPNFVGRVGELRELRAQLTGGAVGVVTAVHGIGGMGKTELALTYAHAYAASYQGGTWHVDADGQTDMLEAVSRCASSPTLGLQVSERAAARPPSCWVSWCWRSYARRTEAARAPRRGHRRVFLLLDNVSEPELLSETQLAVLPDRAVVSCRGHHPPGRRRYRGGGLTRLGGDDRGGPAFHRGRLALLREHQPARDPARLHPDFSSRRRSGRRPPARRAARRLHAGRRAGRGVSGQLRDRTLPACWNCCKRRASRCSTRWEARQGGRGDPAQGETGHHNR